MGKYEKRIAEYRSITRVNRNRYLCLFELIFFLWNDYTMNKNMKLIFKFAKPHKFKFIVLLTCVITTTFSGTLYPYLLGRLVDEVLYNKNMSSFLMIVLLYGLVYLVGQILHTTLNITWANLMTRFLFDIRKSIFKKVLSYEGKILSSLRSGDVIYRMGVDTEQFMNYIHWNTFYLAARILKLLISIGFLIYLSWPIAVFTVIMTPIAVYTSKYFAKKLKNVYKNISDSSGLLSSWLFEIIKGMQEIRLLSASKSVISDYMRKTIKIVRLRIKGNKIEVFSERINSGVSLIWQLVLYLISVYFIYNGDLTLGGFTACISYFSNCISSFNAFNNHLTEIAGNMVSVDRVFSMLSEPSEKYNYDNTPVNIINGQIKFDNVSFSYDDDMDVLNEVSFTVLSGEKVALVGHSGAGKSTIANLVLKLFEVKKGKILIDNTDIADCNLHSLRNQIGIVQQDVALFDGTIRYNLIFSDDDFNDSIIFDALKRAHLYDFVMSLPNGLDTILGNTGRALSGGQKQRLALVRVFVKNPKILIFDEATSSLDNEAEQVIKESWDQLCEGRTIMIIAHRLSTIINADKILVLHNHKIAGYDTHSNLLDSCEVYTQLFKEQYNLQEGVSALV
jgi:ABC-type multidrug transport system fused ATPase/permease subunit